MLTLPLFFFRSHRKGYQAERNRNLSFLEKVKKNCQNKDYLISLIEQHSVCCKNFRKDLENMFK